MLRCPISHCTMTVFPILMLNESRSEPSAISTCLLHHACVSQTWPSLAITFQYYSPVLNTSQRSPCHVWIGCRLILHTADAPTSDAFGRALEGPIACSPDCAQFRPARRRVPGSGRSGHRRSSAEGPRDDPISRGACIALVAISLYTVLAASYKGSGHLIDTLAFRRCDAALRPGRIF